jgi:hypothetical protein
MSVGFLASTQLSPGVITVPNGTQQFDQIYQQWMDSVAGGPGPLIFRPGLLRSLSGDGASGLAAAPATPGVAAPAAATATNLSAWWIVGLIVLLFLIF